MFGLFGGGPGGQNEGNVKHVKSASDFDRYIRDSGLKLVVVDFTAKWCGPCKQIAPEFARMSTTYPNVVFLKVDVDEQAEVASKAGVRAMPTFHFYKKGAKIDEFTGANVQKLEQTIQKHATAAETFSGSGYRLGGSDSAAPVRNPWAAAPVQASAPPAPSTVAVGRPIGTALPAPVATEEDDEIQRAIALSLLEAQKGSSTSSTPVAEKPAETAADVEMPDSTPSAPSAPAAAAASESESESAAEAKPTDDPADGPMETGADGIVQLPAVDAELMKQLDDMGFPSVRCQKALLVTGGKSLEKAIEWLEEHQNDADIDEPWTVVGSAPGKPKMSVEEQRKRIQDAIQKAKSQRQQSEAESEKERERMRRESGKKMLEAKRSAEEVQLKKDADARKKEKENDKKERERLRILLEEDKKRRAAKLAEARGDAPPAPAAPPAAPAPAVSRPPTVAKTYTECQIQVRLTDGTMIKETFKPSDKLRAVHTFVKTKRTDAHGAFSLVNKSAYPPKTIPDSSLDTLTLEDAGLVPSGSLLVTK